MSVRASEALYTLGYEFIPDPMHRKNVTRLIDVGLDLLAKPGDVVIDGARGRV